MITYLFFFLCIGLFILNSKEKRSIASERGLLAAQILLTPSQKILMFDYPASMKAVESVVNQFPDTDNININDLPENLQSAFKKAEEVPYWKGFYGMRRSEGKNWEEKPWPPMFEKIRQGEYWRLFSPALLHSDLLHIIFNLAWLWILGRQIENRLSKIKMFLLVVLIGIVANICQYLMNGPFFLGFSAIVVGLAGFIWSRQKVAP